MAAADCQPATSSLTNGDGQLLRGSSEENVDRKSLSSSPGKKSTPDKTKRKGRGASGRKKEKAATTALADQSSNASVATTLSDDDAAGKSNSTSNFDCSGAIAQVFEGLVVSAVSGTRMGASLEAALLDFGVTAVVSTSGTAATSETFEHHSVVETDDHKRQLHDACDFIHEAVSEGGVVFIHSRAGFSRSDWAVLVVLGYMIKYQSVSLKDALETLSETTKHAISPHTKFRKDLVVFEEEALGESSVSESWQGGEDDNGNSKNHSLSRRKLAENLNDRRLLKKKSPHK